MKYILLPLILSLSLSAAVSAAPGPDQAPPTGRLKVQILGLKSDRGDVIFALYNSPKTYTKKAYRTAFVPVKGHECEWVADDVPVGDYAVVVVHDKNGNHDMDRNFLGIPREPYAFSNNVRATFGAPSFRAAKFQVTAGDTTITIDLK